MSVAHVSAHSDLARYVDYATHRGITVPLTQRDADCDTDRTDRCPDCGGWVFTAYTWPQPMTTLPTATHRPVSSRRRLLSVWTIPHCGSGLKTSSPIDSSSKLCERWL